MNVICNRLVTAYSGHVTAEALGFLTAQKLIQAQPTALQSCVPSPAVGMTAGLGVPNLCHHRGQGRCAVCFGQPHSGAHGLRWQLGGHHDWPESPAVHLHGCPCTHPRHTACPGTHT